MSFETTLKLRSREQGLVVEDGLTYSRGGRLHVVYQKTIGNQIIRVWIAIPMHHALTDPESWTAAEEVITKEPN